MNRALIPTGDNTCLLSHKPNSFDPLIDASCSVQVMFRLFKCLPESVPGDTWKLNKVKATIGRFRAYSSDSWIGRDKDAFEEAF